MGRSRFFQMPHKLKPYDVQSLGMTIVHAPVTNKKWCATKLGFIFAIIGLLLLMYMSMYHQLQTRIGEIVNSRDSVVAIEGWNYNTSRDMKQYVLPDNTTAVQQPNNLCSSPVFVLIIVTSAVDDFDRRMTIRELWGSERLVDNVTIKTTFLLGQTENNTIQDKLFAEHHRYNDIIQERFIDSYNNLTLKSVMMLKWVYNHCGENVNFVMKADDDMFVNIPLLVTTLKARRKPREILMGSLICGAKPVADVKSKWYAPKYMYPGRIYPNYLSGTGYVMSWDTVKRLYKAALFTPLFHLEDIYITGMCARRAGIRPTNHSLFNYQKLKFDPCIYKDVITSHRLMPKEMIKMFNLLRDNRTIEECKNHLNATSTTTPFVVKPHSISKLKRKHGCY